MKNSWRAAQNENGLAGWLAFAIMQNKVHYYHMCMTIDALTMAPAACNASSGTLSALFSLWESARDLMLLISWSWSAAACDQSLFVTLVRCLYVCILLTAHIFRMGTTTFAVLLIPSRVYVHARALSHSIHAQGSIPSPHWYQQAKSRRSALKCLESISTY